MAYDEITDAEIAPGSPPSQSLFTKLRDNPEAMAARDSGAPQILTDYQLLSRTDVAGLSEHITEFDDGTVFGSYDIILSAVKPVTDFAYLYARTSATASAPYTFDSGGSAYHWNLMQRISNTTNISSVNSTASSFIELYIAAGTATGEAGVYGKIQINSPHLVARTHILSEMSGDDTEGNMKWNHSAGKRNASTATTALRLYFSSGNFETGIIEVYGRRNDVYVST